MPPKVKETAPEKAEFKGGLVSNENIEDVLENAPEGVITKKRSFMDKGEDIFTDEEKEQREQLAEGARATLLARMKDENTKSQDDAQRAEQEHQRHKENAFDAAIRRARSKKLEAYIKKAQYYAALSRTGPEGVTGAIQGLSQLNTVVGNRNPIVTSAVRSANNEIRENQRAAHGKLYRMFFWTGTRKDLALSSYEKAEQSAVEAASSIRAESDRWDEYMRQYREGVYKVRSRNYDRLFQSYYVLSRGKQMDAEGEGTNFKRQGDENATEANTNAKDIAEYTGKYNEPSSWANKVLTDPFDGSMSEIVAGKTLNDGSRNTMVGNIKHHTMVTMEAFGQDAEGNQIENAAGEQAGDEPVQRVRIKIDNKFQGYKARNQINAQGNLTADDNFAGAGEAQRRGMEDLNLVADEKGANNELIFSQKSAKIYSATNKRTGANTSGFFVGGEFISSDKEVLKDQTEAKKASSFNKVNLDEKLRVAIRRSDFFRHINSGTIQYYMNYDDVRREVSDQHVEGDYMAKRDSLFSKTKIGQNLLDGTLIGAIGAAAGTTVSSVKEWNDIPDDVIDNTYVSYAIVQSSIADAKDKFFGKKDKGAVFAALSLGSAAILPVSAIFGQADVGAKFGALIGTAISMLRNVSKFVEGINELRKRQKGQKKSPIIWSMTQATLNFLASLANLIDQIADNAVTDVVKGICVVVRDSIFTIKDIVSIIAAGIEKTRITKADERMKTLMDSVKGNILNPTAEDVNEGRSLMNNSQATNFLRLSRKRATRDQWNSGFDALGRGLNAVGTGIGLGDKKAWFNPLSLPFKLASKFVTFLGMGVNKFLGRNLRKDNIEMMLGEKDLDNTPHFNEVLKQETGINNKHYIADLMRVFMTIDMHCLLHKSAVAADVAGFNLAKDALAPYYKMNEGETNESFVSRVSFKRLLSAVGAPGNWRSVLLESIK